MSNLPLPMTNKETEVVVAWIEKQKGPKVTLDLSTALKIAATLEWLTTGGADVDSR